MIANQGQTFWYNFRLIYSIYNMHIFGTAKWSNWGRWEDCSVSCGSGTQKRSRECKGNGDCPKKDASEDIKKCKLEPCGESMHHTFRGRKLVYKDGYNV